jgi:thiol-disulfide isomerase/thioredoxin
MTRSRVIIAALLMIASTIGATAQTVAEPDIKIGEFIPAAAPQPAPEISFDGLDDKPVALTDFRGQYLILDLWATWCAPCLKEMPSLAALQAMFGPALAVLAVSEDRSGAKVVEPFVAEHGLEKLRIALDPKSAAIHALHARGLPTSFVIDRDGQVLGKVEGGAAWDSDQLVDVLRKLMPPGAPKS